MERNHDFRKEVLRALKKRIITKEEAKECLIRGFGKQEIPIFFDFPRMESTPLGIYVLGLEKMGIIKPLIRLNEGI
jgi:hypothetical protein